MIMRLLMLIVHLQYTIGCIFAVTFMLKVREI